MLLNQTQPIEPLDMIQLSRTKYEQLTELNSLFSSIIKNIDVIETRYKSVPVAIQLDREISRLNKQLIADEITNRAEMVPDYYLNELKTLLNA
ncbi:MAG: hypothetical protein KBB58_12620 [Ferruginibacter sp.]|nr:hypothetical protein [Ferruginibacter sp.]